MIKFKKLHPNAVTPTRAHDIDAGADLVAVTKEYLDYGTKVKYEIGLAIEIPIGKVGLLFQRSSVYKKDMRLCNAVGVLDAGYQGNISFIYDITKKFPHPDNVYQVGDKVGQIVIVDCCLDPFKEVDELSDSERGTGGYGSTDNKVK